MSVASLPFTTRRESVLARLAGVFAVVFPQVRQAVARAFGAVRQAVFYVGGFGSVCYGLWQMWAPAGWIAVGVSLLLLEWLTSKPERP